MEQYIAMILQPPPDDLRRVALARHWVIASGESFSDVSHYALGSTKAAGRRKFDHRNYHKVGWLKISDKQMRQISEYLEIALFELTTPKPTLAQRKRLELIGKVESYSDGKGIDYSLWAMGLVAFYMDGDLLRVRPR